MAVLDITQQEPRLWAAPLTHIRIMKEEFIWPVDRDFRSLPSQVQSFILANDLAGLSAYALSGNDTFYGNSIYAVTYMWMEMALPAAPISPSLIPCTDSSLQRSPTAFACFSMNF